MLMRLTLKKRDENVMALFFIFWFSFIFLKYVGVLKRMCKRT